MATKRARKTTKRGATSKKSTKTAKKGAARSTPSVSLRNQLDAVVTAIDKSPALMEFDEIKDLRDLLPNAIAVLKRNPGVGQSEISGGKGGG